MYGAYRSSILLLSARRSHSFKGFKFGPIKRGFLPALQAFTSNRDGKLLKTNHSTNATTNLEKIQPDTKEILYRYKWIKQLRFISRVKILHVFTVSGLTAPMCYWFSAGIISGSVLITSFVAAIATTGGLFALSFFFRRVIGELSFDRSKEEITISSLTFWGNRRNTVVPVSSLVPLSDRDFGAKNLFHRVELHGSDFVYLLNLRHGKVYDSDGLSTLLGLLSGDIIEVKPSGAVGKT